LVLVALVIASSMVGAVAGTHPAMHHASVTSPGALVDVERPPCETSAPHDSGLASLAHALAHAWHHCGVVIAMLPLPVVRLLALLPACPPGIEVRTAPAPVLQGLFRPPIR
jgi:hypothetical protein